MSASYDTHWPLPLPISLAVERRINMWPKANPPPANANSRGIAAIVGVGPGLGRAVARKFVAEGHTVAILARDLAALSRIADEIACEAMAHVFAVRIDCGDPRSVKEAFESVLSLGFVEVLVYNACCSDGMAAPSKFGDVTVEKFERSLAVSAVGAFGCAQQVIPGMVERRKGTIIFTGASASLNGAAGYCELSCGKFALRGLSQCLAREFQVSGIHIAHVVIDGAIGTPRARGVDDKDDERLIDPDAVAQTYWQLHVQDKRAWTQEIDLRSYNSSSTYQSSPMQL